MKIHVHIHVNYITVIITGRIIVEALRVKAAKGMKPARLRPILFQLTDEDLDDLMEQCAAVPGTPVPKDSVHPGWIMLTLLWEVHFLWLAFSIWPFKLLPLPTLLKTLSINKWARGWLFLKFIKVCNFCFFLNLQVSLDYPGSQTIQRFIQAGSMQGSLAKRLMVPPHPSRYSRRCHMVSLFRPKNTKSSWSNPCQPLHPSFRNSPPTTCRVALLCELGWVGSSHLIAVSFLINFHIIWTVATFLTFSLMSACGRIWLGR